MADALITGVTGFIGTQLAEVPVQLGWTVAVVDDLSTGSIKKVAHRETHSGLFLIARQCGELLTDTGAGRSGRRDIPPPAKTCPADGRTSPRSRAPSATPPCAAGRAWWSGRWPTNY